MAIEILRQVTTSSLADLAGAIEGIKLAMDTPEELAGWVVLVVLPILLGVNGYCLRQCYKSTEVNMRLLQEQILLNPSKYNPGTEVMDIVSP